MKTERTAARQPRRRPAWAVPAAVLAGLLGAACAGAPPVRWHSLLASDAAGGARAAADPAAPALWFEIAPVRVPTRVDRAQLVVGLPDSGLAVLEQQRWPAGLADEIRDALVERLAQHTGGVDAGRFGAPAARTVWRVQLELLRFDTVPGAEIVQHAAWAVQAGAGAPDGAALVCRSRVQASAGPDLASAVAAHRRALEQLAQRMAQALRALDRGTAAACAPQP